MTAPSDRIAAANVAQQALSDALYEPRQPKHIVHREQVFQEVAVQFIRKVVLPPMFVAATVNENEMTDNARARAKRRGMVSGLYDLYIAQSPGVSMWQELKWGKNGPSSNQNEVGDMLDRCQIYRAFAWSIHDIHDNLQLVGFALHGGAGVLAVEYQARAEAAVMAAELKVAKKNATVSPALYKQRSRAATPSRTRRWAKIQRAMG
jgi:hypothetical protein